MKINGDDKDSGKYFVHDLNSDFLIMNCTSADDETGEYEIIPSVEMKFEGFEKSYTFVLNEKRESVRAKVKGNIKILCLDNKEDKVTIDRLQSVSP